MAIFTLILVSLVLPGISGLQYRPLGRRSGHQSSLFCRVIPVTLATFIVAIGEVHLTIDEVYLDVVMILA